jgi:hypothetical protein
MERFMFKKMADAHTPAQMRDEINKLRLEEPIVHNAIAWKEVRGLSDEDMYVVVAYSALQSLAAVQQAFLDHLKNSPPPILVHPT